LHPFPLIQDLSLQPSALVRSHVTSYKGLNHSTGTTARNLQTLLEIGLLRISYPQLSGEALWGARIDWSPKTKNSSDHLFYNKKMRGNILL
ncbi:MAG: hypothetical protein ACR2PB_10760, partial [Desulfocapsaceae bacterium]